MQQFHRRGVLNLASSSRWYGPGRSHRGSRSAGFPHPEAGPTTPRLKRQNASGVLDIAHQREIAEQHAGIGTVVRIWNRCRGAGGGIDLLRQIERDALLAAAP